MEDVPAHLENDLLLALQQRNIPSLESLTAGLAKTTRDALLSLPHLAGDALVLERARELLPRHPLIERAFHELKEAAKTLMRHGRVEFDLSELRGYDYHTGLVFSAYVDGFPGAVARGGRYDAVGEAFGRARPATGFSIDLGDLLSALPPPPEARRAWFPLRVARTLAEDVLHSELHRLREQGWVVVAELEGQDPPALAHFDCQLVEGPHGLEPQPID
jgi:ATP phosphoribosyltransferase regulatory subunit